MKTSTCYNYLSYIVCISFFWWGRGSTKEIASPHKRDDNIKRWPLDWGHNVDYERIKVKRAAQSSLSSVTFARNHASLAFSSKRKLIFLHHPTIYTYCMFSPSYFGKRQLKKLTTRKTRSFQQNYDYYYVYDYMYSRIRVLTLYSFLIPMTWEPWE